MKLDVPECGLTVAAPATTANLGPAFDSVGLALNHYAVFTLANVAPGRSKTSERPDLATQSLQRRLDAAGLCAGEFTVQCNETLPQGMGLGSSASAIVAGQLIGAELLQHNGFGSVNPDELLDACVEIEGHPDNVAPCLLGGLTVTLADSDSASASARTTRITVHESISAHVYLPDGELSTSQARVALPHKVPHVDAAANSARAFQLGVALTQSPQLLLEATHDYLHQDYRRQLYPNSWKAVADLRRAGHAAFISGGGPAVVVLTGDGTPSAPGAILGDRPWRHVRLEVCTQGAAIRVPSEA